MLAEVAILAFVVCVVHSARWFYCVPYVGLVAGDALCPSVTTLRIFPMHTRP